MSIIRAQTILRHVSGLPKHDVVNTWHFNGDAASGVALTDIIGRLRDFYILSTGAAGAVASYLSPAMDRVDVKLYDVPGTLTPEGKETPAGPPIATTLGTAGELAAIAKQGAGAYPAEVACCLSFQGTATTGLVQARRRGRVYIGSLNPGANVYSGAVSRPAPLFRQALELAAARLAVDVDDNAEWVVYSRPYPGRDAIVRPGRTTLPSIPARPNGTTVNIDQVWVDDEYDTQRRRGGDRTGRTLVATGE